MTAIHAKKVSKYGEAMSLVGKTGIGREMKFEARRGSQAKGVFIKPE